MDRLVDVNEVEKTEKITIDLGIVDLGPIDLLVREEFYANRIDFIRTAIRTQLIAREAAINLTVRPPHDGARHRPGEDAGGSPRRLVARAEVRTPRPKRARARPRAVAARARGRAPQRDAGRT